jgi:glycerol-3-phosphate dehydrogenase (NAD(P)+)
MAVPVAVLGAGSFGTCLAILCARENDVVLWARDPDLAAAINREHKNPRYLEGAPIPAAVRATADLSEALADRELVICAVPSQGVREVMGRARRMLHPEALVVSTVKGIEPDTGFTMHRVLQDVLEPRHHTRIVCLSGPSFAKEIAQGQPTSVTVASDEEAFAISVQTTLSSPWLRCYSSPDLIGVELGGALKNVIAIAVGTCDGLGLGLNARAALMTRGLAEITRLGVAMGANPLTFQGLSGMGDLVLTCTGDLSRNRRVGIELGKGRKLPEILGEMREVAEGVRTTAAAVALARRYGVEMPIAQMVQAVLDGKLDVREAVRGLMTRQLRSEHEYR